MIAAIQSTARATDSSSKRCTRLGLGPRVATKTRQCWTSVANSSVGARACPLPFGEDLASSEQLASAPASEVGSFRLWHFECSTRNDVLAHVYQLSNRQPAS